MASREGKEEGDNIGGGELKRKEEAGTGEIDRAELERGWILLLLNIRLRGSKQKHQLRNAYREEL